MVKIIFVCHGNICRSPMAEFVFADIVRKSGMSGKFAVSSAATSREELGNPVYPAAREAMRRHGIKTEPHFARQFTKEDYEKNDLVIIMDSLNRRNLMRITGGDEKNKVHTLLEFAGLDRDISDPWYSGDFEHAFSDIKLGCSALFDYTVKTYGVVK